MAYTKKVSAADLALVLGISERRVNQLTAKKIMTRQNRAFDLAENVQAFVVFRERSVAAEYGTGAYAEARTDFIASAPKWPGCNANSWRGYSSRVMRRSP
jgi:hypothetical protein